MRVVLEGDSFLPGPVGLQVGQVSQKAGHGFPVALRHVTSSLDLSPCLL